MRKQGIDVNLEIPPGIPVSNDTVSEAGEEEEPNKKKGSQ